MDVIITVPVCKKCGHSVDDHIEEDDNVYCLGNNTNSEHTLPDQLPPLCPCKERV